MEWNEDSVNQAFQVMELYGGTWPPKPKFLERMRILWEKIKERTISLLRR